MTRLYSLILPVSLSLLAGCAGQEERLLSVDVQQLTRCPLKLHQGQSLLVTLPSNPTTGYRWTIEQNAGQVLRSLGAEAYQADEDGQLIGNGGQSIWRYRAEHVGQDRLRMSYQRPWETEQAPLEQIDCLIEVR